MTRHAVLVDILLIYAGLGDRFYLKFLANVCSGHLHQHIFHARD
jgi:hypothetical protein